MVVDVVLVHEVHVERGHQEGFRQSAFEGFAAVAQFVADIDAQNAAAESHGKGSSREVDSGESGLSNGEEKVPEGEELHGDCCVDQEVIEDVVETAFFLSGAGVGGVGRKQKFREGKGNKDVDDRKEGDEAVAVEAPPSQYGEDKNREVFEGTE